MNAAARKLAHLDLRKRNGLILSAFVAANHSDGADIDACEITREDGNVFVDWWDPTYETHSPRTYAVTVKGEGGFQFEEG